MTNNPFETYAIDFQQSVIQRADLEDSEQLRPEAFTETVLDLLEQEGEVEDAIAVFHRQTGIELSGYAAIPNEGRLDLFVTSYSGVAPSRTVARDDITARFRRLKGFLTASLKGLHAKLEESSPAFDAALTVHEMDGNLNHIRLILLTDGLTRIEHLDDERLAGAEVAYSIWDLEKIFRLETSGLIPDPIDIDFQELTGSAVPCLQAPDDSSTDYRAYLALLPGGVLADVYKRYGSRLLERNVRAFLSVRGGVNRGIRDTIAKDPQHFLAYNNGITATAESVELISSTEGQTAIKRLRNFQIVNGGQTTASLFNAVFRDKADLSKVAVQAKVIEVPPEHLDELVPLVSRYSNSQNRISESDFEANDPFHVAIQQYSRSVWAPGQEGNQRQTRWFYERARGQYQDMKSREMTPARQREFVRVHPNAQKFTKTDLAKFENTWAQLPHITSLGAQKSFREFTLRLGHRGSFEPNETYFRRLVAKGIMFRRTEKIVQAQGIPGYRAYIVTYTLAFISHATASRIDLDAIWIRQGLSESLEMVIDEVAKQVRKILLNPPNSGDVTNWAKNEKLWPKLQDEVDFDALGALSGDLLERGQKADLAVDRGIESLDKADQQRIGEVSEVGGDTWFAIAAWAKDTNNLESWQRGISFSIGRALQNGRAPSRKQARQGEKILAEASRLGFKITA
jgi:hypothetical protein